MRFLIAAVVAIASCGVANAQRLVLPQNCYRPVCDQCGHGNYGGPVYGGPVYNGGCVDRPLYNQCVPQYNQCVPNYGCNPCTPCVPNVYGGTIVTQDHINYNFELQRHHFQHFNYYMNDIYHRDYRFIEQPRCYPGCGNGYNNGYYNDMCPQNYGYPPVDSRGRY